MTHRDLALGAAIVLAAIPGYPPCTARGVMLTPPAASAAG